MDDVALLSLAADLARQAGATILAIRARGFDKSLKADASPVTEADHAAEALIVAGLRRVAPDIPVVAEEEIAAGHVPDRADSFWLVDPLDGTKEFAALRDDFAVNIGLIRDGRPVLGVVGVPAQGELYGGIVGQGAWKRTSAGERRIAVRAVPAAGLDVIASRAHANDERMTAYLAGRTVRAIINAGSALKFCRVAEGAADLYPRFGRTMEWDTGAPQAVVEAAGGSVRVVETGKPLRYGKPGWDNPHFVCAGLA
jgi:3'(2'), 5'-bisphosphate nucleotidase